MACTSDVGLFGHLGIPGCAYGARVRVVVYRCGCRWLRGCVGTVGDVVFSPVTALPNGTYEFTMRGALRSGTAVLDVSVTDAYGRVGVWPQPEITVLDMFGAVYVAASRPGRCRHRDLLGRPSDFTQGQWVGSRRFQSIAY